MINWERRDIWEQRDVKMIAWFYKIVDELLCHWFLLRWERQDV